MAVSGRGAVELEARPAGGAGGGFGAGCAACPGASARLWCGRSAGSSGRAGCRSAGSRSGTSLEGSQGPLPLVTIQMPNGTPQKPRRATRMGRAFKCVWARSGLGCTLGASRWTPLNAEYSIRPQGRTNVTSRRPVGRRGPSRPRIYRVCREAKLVRRKATERPGADRARGARPRSTSP